VLPVTTAIIRLGVTAVDLRLVPLTKPSEPTGVQGTPTLHMERLFTERLFVRSLHSERWRRGTRCWSPGFQGRNCPHLRQIPAPPPLHPNTGDYNYRLQISNKPVGGAGAECDLLLLSNPGGPGAC